MFKRLLAVAVLVLGVAGSAFAQLDCTIENDFGGGGFTGGSSSYSITVGPGQAGTLRAAQCPGANSFNWSPGNAQTSSISVVAPQSGSASYSLLGCNASTQTCGKPGSITLVVAAANAPDCTLAAAPNPATSGQTVTFTATCNPQNAPAASINYTDLSGNIKTSTSLTFTDIAPAVTSPTVRTVDYHPVSARGVNGTLRSIQVTINPAPVVQPPSNCTLTAQPNPVTQGSTTLLSAACANGAPVTTYTFSDANQTVIQSTSANTVVVTPPALGANRYDVRATNSGGQSTATVLVNVLPQPPSGCTLAATPNPITLGASTVLTARCTGGGTPANYRFTYPDGTVVDQATPTLTVSPPTAGNPIFGVVVCRDCLQPLR